MVAKLLDIANIESTIIKNRLLLAMNSPIENTFVLL